jgi:hypothetical protein
MAARQISPSVASAVCRVAGLKRHHDDDNPKVQDAQRDLRYELVADHIKKVVDAAPPLTAQQRNRLTELLEPVRVAPKGAGRI